MLHFNQKDEEVMRKSTVHSDDKDYRKLSEKHFSPVSPSIRRPQKEFLLLSFHVSVYRKNKNCNVKEISSVVEEENRNLGPLKLYLLVNKLCLYTTFCLLVHIAVGSNSVFYQEEADYCYQKNSIMKKKTL